MGEEIDFRRKKFLQFNGSYEDFIAKSDKKRPNLVIVINQFDVFAELYNNESEFSLNIAPLEKGFYKIIITAIIKKNSKL